MALFTFLLTVFTALTSAQLSQSLSNGSKLLRFVAQLSVSGCPIFVHDTGAPDGPHLEVEPLMCVAESLHGMLPRYDPITQQSYVSVAVMLTDDAILKIVKGKLGHLSPKSVKFATVSDISVSTDASSVIQGLGFDWSSDEATGVLRIGCKSRATNCSGTVLVLQTLHGEQSVLNSVLFTVSLFTTKGLPQKFNYRLIIQNQTLFDASVWGQAYLPGCENLRFVQSIKISNCTARVHQRLDMKGHFLIEPLLCHNASTSMTVTRDRVRAKYYLKLEVILQDDVALVAINQNLTGLSPLSVTFMPPWKVQTTLASALMGRLEISELMVSEDKRSAQVLVYCETNHQCLSLRQAILENPFRLWRNIRYRVVSHVPSPSCGVTSSGYAWPFSLSGANDYDRGYSIRRWWMQACRLLGSRIPGANLCSPKSLPDGRQFTVVQQRVSGRTSFQQSWLNYEAGFGAASDYWVGLSAIHSLSANGATFRVEMTLLNGAERYAEYSEFKVGDSSTNYQMSYREMLRDRSNFGLDRMEAHNGMKFSTMDGGELSYCSELFGKGGWWFNGTHQCHHLNPNGLFPAGSQGANYSYVGWGEGIKQTEYLPVRLIRLMIEI